MNIAIAYSREDRLYTVGLEQNTDDASKRRWYGLADCENLDQVMQIIHYLHGGTRPGFLNR